MTSQPKRSDRKRIAIDMDDVLADQISARLKRYNEAFDTSFTPDALQGKTLETFAPPERRERVRGFLEEPGFFINLPVMPDAQQVVRELSETYDVFIATAAMEVPNSFREKYIWLRQHFPFLDPMNFIFCGHKFFIDADYLIDDTARHLDTFGGEGILFGGPHNVDETGYQRVESWAEVREVLLR